MAQLQTMEEERVAEILVRSWRPDARPRGVVTIVHGVNSRSGYYLWAAEQLAAVGLAVYALDLHFTREELRDVGTLVRWAKSREPGLPLFLLGHAASGVIACTYTLDHQDELAGLICESFAFQMAAPDIAMKGLSHLAPHGGVLRLVKRLNAAPVKRDTPRLTLPVLIIHGTVDKVARPNTSKLFDDRLQRGSAHDLLDDLDEEQVMADLIAWLDLRLSRPSTKWRGHPQSDTRP